MLERLDQMIAAVGRMIAAAVIESLATYAACEMGPPLPPEPRARQRAVTGAGN